MKDEEERTIQITEEDAKTAAFAAEGAATQFSLKLRARIEMRRNNAKRDREMKQ